MSSGEKIIEDGGEGPSHEPPQAITIHIMAPSDLGNNAIDSALVASVETQDTKQESDSSLLVVPAEDETISVSAKNIIRTVTETNVGSEDLPVISNINSDQVSEQSIELVTKDDKQVEEIVEEDIGCHCLICNEELQEENNVPVFKSFTETSQRKVSVFLGDLVGHKLTSRKTHSTIICSHCFKLLNKLDLLEFEIQETKEKIVTKYQATVAAYGGRARRKKSAAANKSDYVFPKIEPEEEEKVDLEVEGDDIYQPQVDDLLEEEQDKREDRDSMDEEWEPEIKRARIKRESSADPNGPPKRKRGRPRKDAANPKNFIDVYEVITSKEVKVGQECQVLKTVVLEREMPVQLSNTDRPSSKGKSDSSNELETATTSTRSSESVQGVQTSSKADDENHKKVVAVSQHCKIEKEIGPVTIFSQHCKIEKEIGPVTIFSAKKSQEENVVKIKELMVKTEENGVKMFSDKQCPVCDTCFPKACVMKDHFKKYHSPTVSLSCKNCNRQLPPNFKIFFKHCKSCFPKEQQYKGSKYCYICQKAFKCHEYWNHMASHKVEADSNVLSNNVPSISNIVWKFNDKQCPVCDTGFIGYMEMMYHYLTHHSSVKSLSCKYCKTELSEYLPEYIRHSKSCFPKHKQANNNWITSFCGVCQEEMMTSEYKKHMVSHSMLPCPVCSKEFSRDILRKHLVTHNNSVFACVDCSLVYERICDLYLHRKRNHLGEKGRPHLCAMCGKKFVAVTELRYHVRATHENVKKFMCEICGAPFIAAGSLTAHKRIHTGEKPYKCKFCSKPFRRSNDLAKHLRKVHDTEYQYKNKKIKVKVEQSTDESTLVLSADDLGL